jgi:hypothetical protein
VFVFFFEIFNNGTIVMTWLQVGFQLLWLMFNSFVPCFVKQRISHFFFIWLFWELNIGGKKRRKYTMKGSFKICDEQKPSRNEPKC